MQIMVTILFTGLKILSPYGGRGSIPASGTNFSIELGTREGTSGRESGSGGWFTHAEIGVRHLYACAGGAESGTVLGSPVPASRRIRRVARQGYSSNGLQPLEKGRAAAASRVQPGARSRRT
jgi:hypothetical protein